ncbi:MAG: phospholipid transport system substrate-binding protein, partial [Paracoccaceae bacterium]
SSVAWGAGPAAAATEAEAITFVTAVVAEVEALVKSGRPVAEQAGDFRKMFARRAASEQAVRFVMGIAWREMTADQQKRMHEAFLDHIARVYAELLSDYRGQTIEIGQAQDFGKKGILVRSFARSPGDEDVSVEWLVSDRGGNGLQLVDITIVGISLLQSQRQEFAAMLEKRGGNIDTLIRDLATG